MRIPVWMVALAAAAMVGGGVGCSGGGDDDDDDDDDGSSLTTGTYTVSGGTTTVDDCESLGDLADLNGAEINVTATGTTVTFEDLFSAPLDHDLVGTTFTYEAEQVYAWEDPAFATGEGLTQAYNCHEVDIIEYSGTITSQTSFTYDMSIMYTASSGMASLCTAANTSAYMTTFSVPCSSTGSFDGAI